MSALLGVAMCLGGTCAEACGMVLQRRGLLLLKREAVERQLEKPRPVFRSWTWVVGFLVMGNGSLLNIGALAFAEQRIITPLGAVVLVWNGIWSRMFLGEPFLKTDYAGTVVIGAALAVLIGCSPEATVREYTADELRNLLMQSAMVVFMVCLLCLMGIMYAFVAMSDCRKRPMNASPVAHVSRDVLGDGADCTSSHEDVSSNCREPLAPAMELDGSHDDLREAEIESQAIMSSLDNPASKASQSTGDRLLRLFLASLAGCFAASTTLSAKASSSVIRTSLAGNNQFTSVFAIAAVPVMLTSAVLQVFWINRSLSVNLSLFHMPIQFVVWNVLAMVGGALWLGEFSKFANWQLGMFAIAAITLCVGVYVISNRPPPPKDAADRIPSLCRRKMAREMLSDEVSAIQV